MTLARWTNGMLARALDISPSYAREIRIGERPLGDERLAVLLRFDRLATELRAVGLVPAITTAA